MTENEENDIRSKIQQLYSGLSLKAVLGSDTAKIKKFFDAVNTNPLMSILYNSAQQARAELLADEIIDISDNEPDANRARVMVDARKWYASKMQPSKYGDRIDLNVTQNLDISTALMDARQRVKSVQCQEVIQQIAQVPEIIGQLAIDVTGYKPVSKPLDDDMDDIFS